MDSYGTGAASGLGKWWRSRRADAEVVHLGGLAAQGAPGAPAQEVFLEAAEEGVEEDHQEHQDKDHGDGADEGEGEAHLEAGDDPGRGRGQDHLEEDLPLAGVPHPGHVLEAPVRAGGGSREGERKCRAGRSRGECLLSQLKLRTLSSR